MQYSSQLLYAKAGQVPPREYVEKLVSSYRSGFAYVELNEFGLDIDFSEPMSLDETMLFMETQKASDVVYEFLNTPSELHADDKPPMTLLEQIERGEDGKDHSIPLLVGFFQGNFSSFHQEASGHSDQFFAINTYFKEKISNTFVDTGGDLDKMCERLQSKIGKTELEAQITVKGSICLVAENSKILFFGKNTPRVMSEWGWTTYEAEPVQLEANLGSNKPPEPNNPEKSLLLTSTPKRLTPAERAAARKAASTQDAIIDQAKKTGEYPSSTLPAAAVLAQEKKEAAPNPAPEILPVLRRPPENLRNLPRKKRNVLQGWYVENAVNGVVPNDWREAPEVLCWPIINGKIIKSLADLPTEKKPADKTATSTTATSPGGYLPFAPLSAAEKAKVIADIKTRPGITKAMNIKGELLIDPVFLKDLDKEDKRVSAAAQANMDPEAGVDFIYGWDEAEIAYFIAQHPKWMTTLFMDLRKEHYDQQKELDGYDALISKEADKSTKVA